MLPSEENFLICYHLLSIYRKFLVDANCPNAKTHTSTPIIKRPNNLVLITVPRLTSPVLYNLNLFPKEPVVQI